MRRQGAALIMISMCSVLIGCKGPTANAQHENAVKPPAGATLFALSDCLGKDFSAYEKSLGKPKSRETDKGEARIYKNDKLMKAGASEVLISQTMTKHVDYIRIVLKVGTTWQDALKLIGVEPTSVTTVDGSGSVNGTPYTKTLFTGIRIQGVPMAAVKTAPWTHFGKGYGVTYGAGFVTNSDGKSAYGKSPMLQIDYTPND